jgi:SNF2 family DNA or RNA helicase
MLVSLRHKKLVINSRTPNKLLSVIPTAKRFEYKGHELVAVPHKLDEVQVLNNLGIKAPSPIAFHYDWPHPPGQPPFEAQRVTAAMATIHRRLYILNDLGTGKTRSVLWAADYLMQQGRVNRVAIFCPLSTMERTWGDEIFRLLPEREAVTVYGDAKKRVKLLQQDADFYIINHHGAKLKGVMDALLKRKDIDLIIIDELAVFRNTRSDLYKAMKKLVNKRERVWGMTGTPTPNAPTDAFAQCKLLTPETVPDYFGQFRESTMYNAGPFGWAAKKEAMDVVFDAMQPAVRYSREECVDLPECMYMTRHCALSPEAHHAYEEMRKHLKVQMAEGTLVALNKAVMTQKLLQIACGVAYGPDKQEVVFPAKERIEAIHEIVEESKGKVIVFVPFTAALNMIAEEIGKFASVATVDGSVGKTARDKIFLEFQQEGAGPRVLVAQPASMAHGLTLTEANTIVWYGPVPNNDTYEQANGRITRPGQKRQQLIVHLEGTPIERKVYTRLAEKSDLQSVLLDAVSEA